jgi:hypothetical protein
MKMSWAVNRDVAMYLLADFVITEKSERFEFKDNGPRGVKDDRHRDPFCCGKEG